MQNVYKCVYDYDDQQIDRLTKNGSSILGLFKVIVENERFVLMPVNHLNAKDRSVYFNEIEKVKMTLSTGAATRITINRATIYQIDLNIYFHDGSLFTLEFRSFRGVVSLIKKFAEIHIYVYDPMNLLEIISMDDRWAIEKYFATNLEKIKKQFQVEEMRKKDRYVKA